MMTSSLLFNPSQVTTEELESTFVGRHALIDQLEADLLHDRETGTPRHWQIIGPRGSGKSHLSELLARRMKNRHSWRVARLPEENYRVATLGELLEQIAIRSDSVRPPAWAEAKDIELQDRAVDWLRGRLEVSKLPLLVVLENLSARFDQQLKSVRDQGRLRDILTNNPPFILLGTSTSQSSATTNHAAPLFDFFHTIVLADLNRDDVTALVKARAGWENNAALLSDFDRVKGRIDAIFHLSGGNPRLALALYRALQHGVTSALHADIMKLLDEVTPYYQARLNDISPQAARVLTEMAVADTVVTPATIARRCRMATNQITAQVNKLLDERLIVAGARPDARSQYYEFKDRLLRIWIQMRESVGAARRLRFLAEFFDRWYEGQRDELEEASRRTLSDLWTELDRGDERQCGDRLKTLSYLADIQPGFDHSVVLSVMATHVGESTESDIRTHVDALRRMFDAATDLREREALSFLLWECFSALGTEQDSRAQLRSVLNDGSESEAIAQRYVSTLVSEREYRIAWEFGRDWLIQHPSHKGMNSEAAVAALGVGEFDSGIDALEKYTASGRFCGRCVEKSLRRAIVALRDNGVNPEIENVFWQRLVGTQAAVATASPSQIRAALDVLATFELSQIPPRTFIEASHAWLPLASAPSWFFLKAICGLSHRRSFAVSALRIIEAFAARSQEGLGQYAIDHLVDILPQLRNRRSISQAARSAYDSARQLVERRTTPESLGTAFRSSAPKLAKRYPDLVKDIVAIYREWTKDGLLSEPMTPYSELVAVIESPDKTKALQALHAETREAVSLLLDSMTSHKTKSRANSHEEPRA